MCRMVAFWSDTPRSFPEILGEHWNAFVDLSRKHGDGWGLTWIDATGSLRRVKAPDAAYASSEFARAAVTVRACCGILHLRRASEGLAISDENTQPFVSSGPPLGFAHNGEIRPFDRLWDYVRDEGDSRREGSTDSEAYLRLTSRAMVRGASVTEALKGVVHNLQAFDFKYSSLNAMVIHPNESCIVSEYRPEAPLALENPDYYNLYLSQKGEVTTVASSEWPVPSSWVRIPNHSIVSVQGGHVTIAALNP